MNEFKTIKPDPIFEKLSEECRILKDELAELFVELEYITKTVIPNLEAEYAVKIGVYQYELLQLQIEYLRIKREMELIQAAINKNETIDAKQIQNQLDNELIEWKTKLDSQMDEIKQAELFLSSMLSSEDSLEITRIYRILAKKLHPDVNPDQTQDAQNLWLQVQSAYEMGDLTQMQALFLMAEDIPDNYDLPNSMEIIKKRRSDFKDQIKKVLQKLADAKKHPVFEWEEFLQDPVSVIEKQNIINLQIDEIKEQLVMVKLILSQLKADNNLE